MNRRETLSLGRERLWQERNRQESSEFDLVTGRVHSGSIMLSKDDGTKVDILSLDPLERR